MSSSPSGPNQQRVMTPEEFRRLSGGQAPPAQKSEPSQVQVGAPQVQRVPQTFQQPEIAHPMQQKAQPNPNEMWAQGGNAQYQQVAPYQHAQYPPQAAQYPPQAAPYQQQAPMGHPQAPMGHPQAPVGYAQQRAPMGYPPQAPQYSQGMSGVPQYQQQVGVNPQMVQGQMGQHIPQQLQNLIQAIQGSLNQGNVPAYDGISLHITPAGVSMSVSQINPDGDNDGEEPVVSFPNLYTGFLQPQDTYRALTTLVQSAIRLNQLR